MRNSDATEVASHGLNNASERQPFEVTVERILPGGLGLAHAEGRTVMVALTAPGDRLRVRIDRVKGNVVFASIVEVIEPSPVRLEPPCPYFGRCGGCDFQQLNYEAQLDAKIGIIRDCLHRIARLEPAPEFEIIPAPQEWHYRARAQWQYDSVRRRFGYYEANSHRVCDVAECAVLVPELQWILEDLRGQTADGLWPNDPRYFRAIVGDESALVATGPRASRAAPNQVFGDDSISVVDDELESITRTVAGETYRLNPESFFQTNVDLLPQLIDYVLGDSRGEDAIELYSGVGLFTVPLARRFKRVTAVEDDADATNFARENLAAAGLANAEVVNCDVGDWFEEHLECALQTDFLLLDPPRAGAESVVIAGIARLKPPHISYVSCDPATLARDLKKLIASGYRIDRLRAFDMFPQTHHVETVVHLTL